MTPVEREVNTLVSALVDDNIDEASFSRLNELMETSAEARAVYIKLTHFHAELADVALQSVCALPARSGGESRRRLRPPFFLQSLGQAIQAGWRHALQIARQPTSISLTTATLVVGLLIAAMAAVAIPVYRYTAQQPTATVAAPLTVARITRTHSAVWPDEFPTGRQGSTLVAGSRVQLEGGLAELTFTSGARVLIEGPVIFQVVTSMSGYLERGRLTAAVPRKAAGFSIRSPCANVIDLGTEFGAAVDEHGTTDVRVFVGSVEVAMTDAQQDPSLRLVLEEGQSTRVTRHDRTFRDIPADAEPLVRTTALSGLLAEEKYNRWNDFINGLRDDPAVVALYPFAQPGQSPDRLPNIATTLAGRFTGTVEGPNWAPGRWKEKGALQFNEVADCVELDFSGEQFAQLTLAAWVNLKQLPHTHNALVYSQHWNRPGAVHWTLLDDGRIEFAVAENQPPVMQSEPASLQYRLGRWVHLALVYDQRARSVRFYINGKPQGAQTYSSAYPADLREVQLGSWNQESRNVRGRMDELIIYRRALSGKEIQHVYSTGAP